MKDPTCPFLSHKLPPDINEVAYVIAKINKYGNIDDYAEKLIREDIEKRRRKRKIQTIHLNNILIQYYYYYYHHRLLIRLLQMMIQPKKMVMIMKISV